MSFSYLKEIEDIAKEQNIPFWRVIIEDDMKERNVSFEESFETIQGSFWRKE